MKRKSAILLVLITTGIFIMAATSFSVAEEEEAIPAIFDLEPLAEIDSNITSEEIAEAGEELGYDHLIWDINLDVYEAGETDSVNDILEEDVTDIVEAIDEIEDITDELIRAIFPETLKVGIVDMLAVMDDYPDINMPEIVEIGEELGYDYLIWDTRLELFEEGEMTEIIDLLEENITNVIEETEKTDEITDEIIENL